MPTPPSVTAMAKNALARILPGPLGAREVPQRRRRRREPAVHLLLHGRGGACSSHHLQGAVSASAREGGSLTRVCAPPPARDEVKWVAVFSFPFFLLLSL